MIDAFRQRLSLLCIALFVVTISATVATACTSGTAASPTPTPQPTPTSTPIIPTPQPILFPQDEAPHENTLEWWYYNGHLEDESGAQYGFHLVLFQGSNLEGAVGYIAQATITDLKRDTHAQTSRITTGEQAQPSGGFSFTLQDWQLQGTPDAHSFTVQIEDYALALTMTPTKPAAFHDEDGFLIGPEGWTYYYTRPRMEAQGTLTLGDQTLRVSGTSWMDHQWGDFAVSGYPAGWQWFAIQFDDGTELMVTEFRDASGVTSLYGTLVETDGSTQHIPGDDLTLEVLGTWTSPHTDAEYPAGWRLRIASRDLEIELQPLQADQEVTVAFPPNTIYWEGTTSVTAQQNGTPLSGRAFVELVGYVQVPGFTPPS